MRTQSCRAYAVCITLASSHLANGQVPGAAFFVFPAGQIFDGGAPVAVELWVTFGGSAYAWAEWDGSIVSGDAEASWQNLASNYLPTPFNTLGTPVAGGVNDIVVSQLHFPPAGVFANTSNPIMIWSGEWSTPNLTPRSVSVMSVTDKAVAYTTGYAIYLDLSEASAQIQVIPAPPSLAFLALASGLASRGRRVRAQGRVCI